MPASPTRTQSINQIQDPIRLVDAVLAGVQNVVANQLTLEANLVSDFASQQTAGAAAFRSRVNRALLGGALPLTPAIQSFVKHQVGTPERDIQIAISRLYQDLIDAGETIQSRAFTFGPVTPDGGNTGDGTISRLTEDEEGFDLEATNFDTKTVICTQDQQGGAVAHQELFRFRGETSNVDRIELAGSGLALSDESTRSKISSDSLLQNTGFEQFALGNSTGFAGGIAPLGTTSTVTGWELNDPADASDPTLYELDQNKTGAGDRQFRDLAGVTNPTSLRMVANARLRQAFSVNNVELVFARPYAILLHVFKESAADGTLTITWGNKTQAFSVAGMVNTAWNVVQVDLDRDLWPSQFNTSAPVFQAEWSGRTVGSIVFDEFEALVPMTRFNGHWWHISGGEVQWLDKDEVTAADVLVGADSQLQKWLFRLYGRHLPHSGAPTMTWAEPF